MRWVAVGREALPEQTDDWMRKDDVRTPPFSQFAYLLATVARAERRTEHRRAQERQRGWLGNGLAGAAATTGAAAAGAVVAVDGEVRELAAIGQEMPVTGERAHRQQENGPLRVGAILDAHHVLAVVAKLRRDNRERPVVVSGVRRVAETGRALAQAIPAGSPQRLRSAVQIRGGLTIRP